MIWLDKGNAAEISGQQSDFGSFLGRSDQIVAILPIKPAERANDIADVLSDTEISAAPDVDRDLHPLI